MNLRRFPLNLRSSNSLSITTARGFVAAGLVFLHFSALGAEPVKLLSQAMHVGDQAQADMTKAEPDGKKFEVKFDWPDRIGFGEVFLVVEVSHMTPRDYPGFDQGFWQTEVYMNGKSVGILNKELRGKVETAKIERVIFPMEATAMKTGENTLMIKPGAKNGQLDDFELHSVEISQSRPR